MNAILMSNNLESRSWVDPHIQFWRWDIDGWLVAGDRVDPELSLKNVINLQMMEFLTAEIWDLWVGSPKTDLTSVLIWW